MSVSSPPLYFYTIHDIPGVALAHNYLSVFNPVGSGKAHVALSGIVSSYSAGTTVSPNSLIDWRITAHSGGTLVNNSTVPRFRTVWPDPVTEIRVGGPTAVPSITSGQPLSAFPPVISAGVGQSNTIAVPPPGGAFLVTPGQGLCFGTKAGDVDQVWSITYIWQEVS